MNLKDFGAVVGKSGFGVTPEDSEVVSAITTLIFSVVFAMNTRKELWEHGHPTGKTAKSGVEFWTPNIVGKDYVLKGQHNGSHGGASPRMHIYVAAGDRVDEQLVGGTLKILVAGGDRYLRRQIAACALTRESDLCADTVIAGNVAGHPFIRVNRVMEGSGVGASGALRYSTETTMALASLHRLRALSS